MAGRGGRPPPREDDDTAFSVVGGEDDRNPDVQFIEEMEIDWPKGLAGSSEVAGQERGIFRVPDTPSASRNRPGKTFRPAATSSTAHRPQTGGEYNMGYQEEVGSIFHPADEGLTRLFLQELSQEDPVTGQGPVAINPTPHRPPTGVEYQQACHHQLSANPALLPR